MIDFVFEGCGDIDDVRFRFGLVLSVDAKDRSRYYCCLVMFMSIFLLEPLRWPNVDELL